MKARLRHGGVRVVAFAGKRCRRGSPSRLLIVRTRRCFGVSRPRRGSRGSRHVCSTRFNGEGSRVVCVRRGAAHVEATEPVMPAEMQRKCNLTSARSAKGDRQRRFLADRRQRTLEATVTVPVFCSAFIPTNACSCSSREFALPGTTAKRGRWNTVPSVRVPSTQSQRLGIPFRGVVCLRSAFAPFYARA